MDILENQRIYRRAKSSDSRDSRHGLPGSIATANKRYACNEGFIRQIPQKPAHTKRRFVSNTPLFPDRPRKYSVPARPAPAKKVVDEPQNVQKTRKQASGFSFPLPSLMTMAVIVGILLFSLMALNWPGLSLPSPAALSLDSDDRAEKKLAEYAGIPLLNLTQQDFEYEEIPLDLIETFEWITYKVKRGDSVYKIALDHGISMDAIIASNNISNARRLAEGTVLRIPNIDGIPYTVQKGDNLTKIANSMNILLEIILDVNDIRSDAITPGQVLFIPGARMAPEALKLAMGELFIYPIRGRLTDGYGFRISPITHVRQFHGAIDLAAPTGTHVRAAMEGKVASVGNNRVLGQFIVLNHPGGYESLYAHLSVIGVKQGVSVRQGEKIGEVGNTGASTGPHLHFAVHKNKRAVNPLDLLY